MTIATENASESEIENENQAEDHLSGNENRNENGNENGNGIVEMNEETPHIAQDTKKKRKEMNQYRRRCKQGMSTWHRIDDEAVNTHIHTTHCDPRLFILEVKVYYVAYNIRTFLTSKDLLMIINNDAALSRNIVGYTVKG